MNENNSERGMKQDKSRIETLASEARQNDKLAFVELIGFFSPYISALARSFRLPDSEYDDLCQVGRIALYRAVYSYDGIRSAFTTYARVCVKNAMVSLVRGYSQGSKLTASGISLEDIEDDLPAANTASAPEEFLLAEEFVCELETAMRSCLSESERTVLEFKLSGIGIAEISVLTGKDVKSVENTLFRARKKLREKLDENNK